MTKQRKRKIFSVKNELIEKSREAMLTAVQIFNNPNIKFKAESFIILSIISWTYLLHAYYRDQGIDYRYHEKPGVRKVFDKTSFGAYKHWSLESCINHKRCPIDKVTCQNIRFLLGIRHEIEHQMTTRIDDLLSARFQASCLNYNNYLKKLFGDEYGIEKHLSFSLQFSSLSDDQVDYLVDYKGLPKNISGYISKFDRDLSQKTFNDSRYAYRVLFIPKTANRKGQADRVIEFVKPDSKITKNINKQYVIFKESEKKKYRPSDIWKELQSLGFKKFGQHQHTELWKSVNAKDLSKGYGVQVAETWYWYESWLNFVKEHCNKNSNLYK